MNLLTSFFIGLTFTWLGVLYAGLLGWFVMLTFALEIVFLDFLSELGGKK